KNNKIYSGLGLPSSSTGNNSEDIGGSSIKSPGYVLRIEVKEVKKSCAVVSDTQQTQVPPVEAASHEYWVACDQCNAPRKNYCDISKDETTQAVREMNFKISSQYHVTIDTYHANSNANSETLPNGWKKNKSRL
nr:hypothetical protein [Tanacetum cinerariifolium]